PRCRARAARLDDLLSLSQTCPWRIRRLRRNRHLEQTAAMVLPCVTVKDGAGGRRLARLFSRSTAVERPMNAMLVVVMSELVQLSLQVRVPDEHVVKKLPSYRTNQPFHKRMGDGYVRERFDLFDLKDAQIGHPTIEPK